MAISHLNNYIYGNKAFLILVEAGSVPSQICIYRYIHIFPIWLLSEGDCANVANVVTSQTKAHRETSSFIDTDNFRCLLGT